MSKKLSRRIQTKIDDLLANTGDMALKRRAKRLIVELNPQKGDRILDAGCGDGYYLHLLSNLGINLDLTGADLDPNALESAKKNLKGKKIRFISQGDLMKKLPFKNNIFDKIILSEVAEHLPDDVAGLRELKRVLKRRGTLVLTVPNQNYPLFWDPVNWVLEHFFNTHIKSGFWAGLWSQHKRLYKPEDIKNVVEKAGLKVLNVESLTWWCLPFNHNLLHFAAKKLYGGGFSENISSAVSKYESKTKRPLLIATAFKIVNSVDRLNDLFQPKNRGVGVFVKALKN